jgi:hypothetical protein
MSFAGAVTGSVALSYDDDLRVASETVGSTSIAYGYTDLDGLLTSAGDEQLGHEPATGLLTGTTLGAVTDTIDYNAFAEPSSYVASFGGSPVYSVSYDRDKRGRIVRKTESVAGGPAVVTEYAV